MDDLAALLQTDIPKDRSNLLDSHANLERVAEYCESNYFQSENKRLALENTKNYTTQSLASVAYQINTLSFNFLQLLDLQAGQLADMESQMNHISQTVSIHKEKVARREIGVLTSNKALSKQYKIIAPANPEKPIKYVRKSIDYNALDEIGHGVRWNVNPRRSSNIQQGSATLPAPTTKPPTPPSQQHIRSNLSTTSGGSTGTLGRNTSSVGTLSKASREYRTPPAVAPPQVPSHYAPSNIVGTIRRQTNYSTLPLAQQQPQIGMVQPNQHASSSGYNHQDSLTSSMPPPPSPLIGNEADHSIYNSTQRGIIGRSGSVSPPLPPPPHDDDHVAFGRPEQGCSSGGSMPAIVPDEDDLPGWVPKNYIEKVVAIYDYYADKDDELSFQENSVIYVLKRNDDGWWEGVMDGITGLFPGNYVEPCV